MIWPTKKVGLSISQKFELIECPFCGANFLIFAVWEVKDDYYDEVYSKVLPQGRCDYCPKCGKEQKFQLSNKEQNNERGIHE